MRAPRGTGHHPPWKGQFPGEATGTKGRRARPCGGAHRPGGPGDARGCARAPPAASRSVGSGAGRARVPGWGRPSAAAAADWSPRCKSPQPRRHSSLPGRASPAGAPEPPRQAALVSALGGLLGPSARWRRLWGALLPRVLLPHPPLAHPPPTPPPRLQALAASHLKIKRRLLRKAGPLALIMVPQFTPHQ